MNVFDKAIVFAIKAHEGQKRKNGAPYIIHPLETATIAATMTMDHDVLAAAVLHDVVEDTKVTMDELEKEFGFKVKELVSSETEDKRRGIPASDTWKIRKEESLEVLKNTKDINVKIIWLSDKLSNIRSLYNMYDKEKDLVWKRFHQFDPEQHYWYYQSIAKLLDDLKDTLAWQEYNEYIKKIFENK